MNLIIYPEIEETTSFIPVYKEIQEIKFFKNPTSCISYFENLSFIEKSISFATSVPNCFSAFYYKISLIWNEVEMEMVNYTKPDNIDFSKKKLIVLMHGLSSNASQFKKIVEFLEENINEGNINNDKAHIYIPRIERKGHAKLDIMAKSIFKRIQNWHDSNINQELKLVLVGVSNGARISKAVQCKLPELKKIKKLKVISIVGANKGSSSVNILKHLPFSSLFFSEDIASEMPTDSERTKKLNEDFEASLEKQAPYERKDYYFAAPHDWIVPNYTSTLMEINSNNAHYAIIPNHGHNSVVKAVSSVIANLI